MTRTPKIAAAAAMALSLSVQADVATLAALPDDLTHLSLEDLLDIQVTSVSRMAEDWSSAPAAIQVLSAADIRRSGARNLPELLRLVTGLHVAQVNGRTWAIASRGFNATLSDKLEVRLDGRTIYTPLFSGVIWEVQDPPLESIERVEVIRGPGASLWGANAMNGVINIVTKSATETQGSLIAARAGNELKQQVYFRQGEDLGRLGSWRAYVHSRSRDATTQADSAWRDNHDITSTGVRGDLDLGQDSLMLSANFQDASMGSGSTPPGEKETMRGADISVQWSRQFSNGSNLQLQASFDRHWRDIPSHFGENRRQWDFELRHLWRRGRHEVVWGGGYHRSSDEIINTPKATFDPAHSDLSNFNVFLQDRISLSDRLSATIGSKFEHNDYTGLEVQPSARLAWRRSDDETLWLAISRASRSPNRVDRDFEFDVPLPLRSNDTFESEEALISELGWRRQLSQELSLDLAGFYADYDQLRGLSPTDEGTLQVANNGQGRALGGELNLLWVPQAAWQVRLGYAWLDLSYHAMPGRTDLSIAGSNEQDPEQQWLLQLSWNASSRLQVNGFLRHVGELPDLQTPDYTELDLRIGYSLLPNLEFELAGRNLLDNDHAEFGSPDGARIQRNIYAGFRWELR